jgi:phage shock protein C
MRERLYRSRRFRIIGGVAGGLADYFNLDPVLIRVLFVIITILHGFGILLYIILWIVVPEEPFEIAYQVKPEDGIANGNSSPNAELPILQMEKKKGSGRIIAGVVLIGIGLVFFADRIIPSFDLSDVMPIAIILIGAALIWNSMKK